MTLPPRAYTCDRRKLVVTDPKRGIERNGPILKILSSLDTNIAKIEHQKEWVNNPMLSVDLILVVLLGDLEV